MPCLSLVPMIMLATQPRSPPTINHIMKFMNGLLAEPMTPGGLPGEQVLCN
jgi:hypothetical protein